MYVFPLKYCILQSIYFEVWNNDYTVKFIPKRDETTVKYFRLVPVRNYGANLNDKRYSAITPDMLSHTKILL